MNPEGAGPLAGRRIAVTRPAHQAQALSGQIEARGGIAVRFPTIAIAAAADPAPLRAAAAEIGAYDLAVFVSANAAEHALPLLTAQGRWPGRLPAAAVGAASARAIARFGVARVIAPEAGEGDSEALLALPEFAPEAMRGRRVAIFRGESGRELLGETLEARGARVTRIACYRRLRPEIDAAPLRALLAQGRLDALTVTSAEGLRNLLALLGAEAAAAAKALPLFVVHRRIGEEARRLGFADVVVTAPGDAGLLAALEARFAALATNG
ncbi:MAG TPA: uroporphyrinogen-III synthase [Candidatus Desulfobacillus sp.]|mgnify:CR=1 FL=1|nr:uroporphyrinogen-III synthase [Candidatus Desulfobacillus sp.]